MTDRLRRVPWLLGLKATPWDRQPPRFIGCFDWQTRYWKRLLPEDRRDPDPVTRAVPAVSGTIAPSFEKPERARVQPYLWRIRAPPTTSYPSTWPPALAGGQVRRMEEER